MSNEEQISDSEESTETETVDSTVTLDETTPMSGEDQETGDTGENQESNEEKPPVFNDEQQQIVNNIDAKGKRQRRQLEAEKEALSNQLKELQSQQPENQRPVIPDVPDKYDFDTDEEFHTANKARDEKLQQAASFDTRAALQTQGVQIQQQEQQRLQQEQTNNAVVSFTENGKKHGFTQEQLSQNFNTVIEHGIDNDVGMHILRRPDGPLVMGYLAANPLELERMHAAGPIGAGALIQSEIATKAAALKPQTSNAPAPLDTLQGAGQPKSERGPKGATFE